MALAALGIVYGDIGTSPLYSVKECFGGLHSVAPTPANVIGVMSILFWALTIVVVFKYLTFVMTAHHQGEGGTFALLALVLRNNARLQGKGAMTVLVMLGLFGASLLYGESIITPAISVLSAVEGLEVATPVLHRFVVPITVGILIALFMVQKRGTGGIGRVFGPAMVVWFLSIAAAGLPWIVREPGILAAVNPVHAVRFFAEHGLHGYLVLGAVVLCITGGEALYADMGHFGVGPIRLAWYALVYPSLLLNYFGQGALLLRHGESATANPFYALVPSVMLYPMVIVATIATIIASQALISGAFSLTSQAVQLGYLPRFDVVHTSSQQEGQIYIPEVRSLMMVGSVAIVLGFQRSSNLAAAYGISVTGTMAITSVLLFAAMRERWGTLRAGVLCGLFLSFDLAFFGANIAKIPQGGWLSILVGALLFTIMTTWHRGRSALRQYVMEGTMPLQAFLSDIDVVKPVRVPGTAVFMSLNPNIAPPAMLHSFKHYKILHEQVIVLSITTRRVPEVPIDERVEIQDHGRGFYQVTANYGFMQRPNVPDVLRICARQGVPIGQEVSYYTSRESLVRTGRAGMWGWRTSLFAFLSRNAFSVTSFFGIPANRVVELGMQIEI